MRKLILVGTLIILASFTPNIFASPSTGWFSGWFSRNNNTSQNMKVKIVWQLKTAMKIRVEMRKIRIKTIKSDPQLKQTFEQIRVLAKRLHKRLSQKLKYNSKYQDLKQQLETIHKELQKERKNIKE